MDRVAQRECIAGCLVRVQHVALLVEGTRAVRVQVTDIVDDRAGERVPCNLDLGDWFRCQAVEVFGAELDGYPVAVSGR